MLQPSKRYGRRHGTCIAVWDRPMAIRCPMAIIWTWWNDVLPLVFGGYYHDSIEDARQTYNDVMKAARRWMSDEQALVATEIVYALTNDKGRSREERAGERYYAGIRETPFAPFVKLCDRFANVAHSCRSNDANNQRMKGIYSKEMPHFLSSIVPPSDDPRRQVPQVVVDEMMGLLQNG